MCWVVSMNVPRYIIVLTFEPQEKDDLETFLPLALVVVEPLHSPCFHSKRCTLCCAYYIKTRTLQYSDSVDGWGCDDSHLQAIRHTGGCEPAHPPEPGRTQPTLPPHDQLPQEDLLTCRHEEDPERIR